MKTTGLKCFFSNLYGAVTASFEAQRCNGKFSITGIFPKVVKEFDINCPEYFSWQKKLRKFKEKVREFFR